MNIKKYKKDIAELIKRGEVLESLMYFEIYKDEVVSSSHIKAIKQLPAFCDKYQQWYSEALVCLEQLLPSRVDDFISYYKPSKNRKKMDVENYTITDYLKSITVTVGWDEKKVVGPDAALNPFKQQLKIVESLKKRFESSLFDIRTMVQADLFDHEIDAASELMKSGYLRASGALAGVVLESHLGVVCEQHGVTLKKNPCLSDFNEELKRIGVIDMSVWRKIQYLSDIRNLCDHKKTKDPTKDQINDLIEGVKKIIKTVF